MSSTDVLEIVFSVFLLFDLISNLSRSKSLGSELRDDPRNFCLIELWVSSKWLTGEYIELQIVSSDSLSLHA